MQNGNFKSVDGSIDATLETATTPALGPLDGKATLRMNSDGQSAE